MAREDHRHIFRKKCLTGFASSTSPIRNLAGSVSARTTAARTRLTAAHANAAVVDGQLLRGVARDTVLVTLKGRVRIAFDADNPARWGFNCPNLYHMATGTMMKFSVSGNCRLTTASSSSDGSLTTVSRNNAHRGGY